MHVSSSAHDKWHAAMNTIPPPAFDVLVVDDDDSARAAISTAVKNLGYACRTAFDGEEAWKMHLEAPADIILSDWNMPRLDGLELCRRTRALKSEGKYTYFVFTTSFADKAHFLQGMDVGADDYFAKPIDLDELAARLTSAKRVLSLYQQLAQKNTTLRRDSQRAFQAARVDALTQASNRLSMDEDVGGAYARAQRYGHTYSIGMCDIDRFKQFNDRFGHLAGDDVLRRVAQTIRAELRSGDSLYRYGGEEFVVLLPEQHIGVAAHAMDRVRRAVEAMRIPTGDSADVVTLSVGVAELALAKDSSPEAWLRRADSALYRAKSTGRNRVELAQENSPVAMTERVES